MDCVLVACLVLWRVVVCVRFVLVGLFRYEIAFRVCVGVVGLYFTIRLLVFILLCC